MRRETVRVIQKPQTDRNGDHIIPPNDAGEALFGCVVWPRASEEKSGGEVGVDGENVAAPDNELARSIAFEDWVIIRGEIHMIDEPPARYIGKKVMLKTKRVRT